MSSFFHLQVLKFNADQLRNNLKYCLQDYANYIQKDHKWVSFDEAKAVVKRLWPGWRGPVEMESPLLQRLTGRPNVLHPNAAVWDQEQNKKGPRIQRKTTKLKTVQKRKNRNDTEI